MYKILLLLFISIVLPIISMANSGIIKNLTGNVSILRDAKIIDVVTKHVLQENDIITTLKRSTAKLILRDKTIITIGQNSKFLIDEYLYQNKQVNAKFSIKNGTFKVITGLISKLSPEKFILKVNNATIGIRGTEFYGMVPKKGPEKIYCSDGEIFIQSQTIKNNMFNVPMGYMTYIENGMVQKPVKYSANAIQTFENDYFNFKSDKSIYDNSSSQDPKDNTKSSLLNNDSSSGGNPKVSNVVIDSNVKNAVNIASGINNIAEQNIHSLSATNRSKVEYIYIKGNSRDVANVVYGSNNIGKSSIGSIKVK